MEISAYELTGAKSIVYAAHLRSRQEGGFASFFFSSCVIVYIKYLGKNYLKLKQAQQQQKSPSKTLYESFLV